MMCLSCDSVFILYAEIRLFFAAPRARPAAAVARCAAWSLTLRAFNFRTARNRIPPRGLYPRRPCQLPGVSTVVTVQRITVKDGL
jgi:hypothetical protein